MSELADNYDSLANDDDTTCYRLGCGVEWADNLIILATDDGVVIEWVVWRFGQITMMN